VLAEHLNGNLNASIGSCLRAASELNDPQVDVLVHGSEASVASQLAEVKKYPGLNKVFTATSDALENPYGQSIANVASSLIQSGGYTNVIAASSSFGKDTIPRIGGKLDL